MKKYIKFFFLILWAGLLAYAAYLYFQHRELLTVEYIRTQVAALGIWAPVVYMLAYTVRPLVFFPTSIMTSASVLLFGPVPAWIFTYIGENFSANFAFLIARFFGRRFVQNHENKFIQKYDATLRKQGFITVLLLRLVPLFPFDFVNYSAGLSSVRHRDYLFGTLIGVLPGLTAYILLAAGITDDPHLLWAAGGMFAILIGGGWLWQRSHAQNKKPHSRE